MFNYIKTRTAWQNVWWVTNETSIATHALRASAFDIQKEAEQGQLATPGKK
jgi:hypothetical protein